MVLRRRPGANAETTLPPHDAHPEPGESWRSTENVVYQSGTGVSPHLIDVLGGGLSRAIGLMAV